MLDPSVTRAVLAVEAPALQTLAHRAGWVLSLDTEALILQVEITSDRTSEQFILRGELAGYKEVPPAWDFIDPDTGVAGTAAAYPLPPSPTPGGGPTLFLAYHQSPRGRVICTPCNRLAFGAYQGPHSNWTLTNWMHEQPSHTLTTVADMVSRINTELQASSGRWAPRARRTA